MQVASLGNRLWDRLRRSTVVDCGQDSSRSVPEAFRLRSVFDADTPTLRRRTLGYRPENTGFLPAHGCGALRSVDGLDADGHAFATRRANTYTFTFPTRTSVGRVVPAPTEGARFMTKLLAIIAHPDDE